MVVPDLVRAQHHGECERQRIVHRRVRAEAAGCRDQGVVRAAQVPHTLNISSDENRDIFSIHTRVSCLVAYIFVPENR
jgi:hypothetical protein